MPRGPADDRSSPLDRSNQEPLPLDAVELVLTFPSHDEVDPLVWIPDEIELVVQHRDKGDTTSTRLSYTSLEGLFLLLDQIEMDQSGHIAFGTHVLPVIHSEERVTVPFVVPLVGSHAEWLATVEALVAETFAELRRRGGDTRQVAADLAAGRFASNAVDPLAVHDRLVDEA